MMTTSHALQTRDGLVAVEVFRTLSAASGWRPSRVAIVRVWESWCLTQCEQMASMMLPGTQLRILDPRDPQSEWTYTVPEED